MSFLFHWQNLHHIWNILKSKMIVIANVLPILQTLKFLVISLSKKRRFIRPFDIENVKGVQTLVISPWEQFYHIFS